MIQEVQLDTTQQRFVRDTFYNSRRAEAALNAALFHWHTVYCVLLFDVHTVKHSGRLGVLMAWLLNQVEIFCILNILVKV